jgi:hypothetical protein
MQVAFGIVCAQNIKDVKITFLVPLNTTNEWIEVPVQIWEGNADELRKRLHKMVDAVIDRSCFEEYQKVNLSEFIPL